jgi:hypothetical protein
MVMLRLWLNTSSSSSDVNRAASGSELERALRSCGRADIVEKCAVNVEMVTDDLERKMASRHMASSSSSTTVTVQQERRNNVQVEEEPITEDTGFGALKVSE